MLKLRQIKDDGHRSHTLKIQMRKSVKEKALQA